eukprot:TRINITY_DN94877_c0_g1_i1.p2 TRINITY_DN94877_c0_g1~~TRINITY_DN94877_c0_g1_i1.p2  ORF type:complete len:127 (-),score=26.40 TRINITY_DN94877_c0_g1_i1:192-572(-)
MAKAGGRGPEPRDSKAKGKLQQKDDDGDFLIVAPLAHNMKTMTHCRVFSGVMAGCIAGVLMFEGVAGILIFVAVTALHSLMIWAKMGFNGARHFPTTKDVFTSQFTAGLLSFILFWTLSFDMVHIF